MDWRARGRRTSSRRSGGSSPRTSAPPRSPVDNWRVRGPRASRRERHDTRTPAGRRCSLPHAAGSPSSASVVRPALPRRGPTDHDPRRGIAGKPRRSRVPCDSALTRRARPWAAALLLSPAASVAGIDAARSDLPRSGSGRQARLASPGSRGVGSGRPNGRPEGVGAAAGGVGRRSADATLAPTGA